MQPGSLGNWEGRLQAAFHADEQRVRTVDELSLTEMAVDELWDLRQSIVVILASKLERQLEEAATLAHPLMELPSLT